MRPQNFLVLLIAGVAFAAGLWFALGQGAFRSAELESGYLLDAPRPLPEFSLLQHNGSAFARKDFTGHWSLLYFGFTYCADICPTSLAVMAAVKAELNDTQGLDDRYYLVSVDPERDTPERLAEYVTYFDPDFLGLTGDFSELDLLTGAVGAVYKIPEGSQDGEYQVAHSSTLTLINPAGAVQAIFTEPFSAETIARDLQRITAAH